MAIVCALCGKKQNAFIENYPLSEAHNDLRICASCQVCIDNLRLYCESDYFRYSESRDKLISFMERSDILPEVQSIVTDQIQQYETKAAILLQNQKEIADKHAKEEEQAALEQAMLERAKSTAEQTAESFLTTVGFNFEGHIIKKYHKTISAEAVLGTGFISEFKASISDFFGVESQAFSDKLETAREAAFIKLVSKALLCEANAIIGISYNYTMFSDNMIAVIVTGTAVTVE